MSEEAAIPDHIARWRAGEVSDDRHLMPPHRGLPYLKILDAVHRELNPRSYLEIGSRSGHSLALARGPTIAIDPVFKLPTGFAEARPFVHLFPMTSDDFFAAHDPTMILGHPIEFAFLDGLHCFEFLLRDFMNTEKAATAGAVIALHDCVPFSSAIVSRNENAPRNPVYDVHPGAWAGDVWKLIPILKRYRPDLQIRAFDCPPTGLVFVSRLDPSSRELDAAYDEIVAKYLDADILNIGISAFSHSLGLISSRQAVKSGALLTTIAPERG